MLQGAPEGELQHRVVSPESKRGLVLSTPVSTSRFFVHVPERMLVLVTSGHFLEGQIL